MHRLHSGLTIVVPIKNGQSASLRSLLKKINSSTSSSPDAEHDLSGISISTTGIRGKAEEDNLDEVQFTDDQKQAITFQANLHPVPGATSRTIGATQALTSSPLTEHANTEVLEKIATEDVMLAGLTRTNKAIFCDFHNADTILFVSGVILPAQQYENETLPETLVFATTYCGSLSRHLDDLLKTSKAGLCRIFSHCVGFPENDAIEDQVLIRYIKRHRQPSAFNSRYNCISKSDIQKEKELRFEIQDFVDRITTAGSKKEQDALSLRKLIQDHVHKVGSKYKWADKPAKENFTEFLANKRIYILPAVIIAIILTIAVIANPDSLGWFLSIGLGIAVIIDMVAIAYGLTKAMMYLIARDRNDTAQRPPDEYVRKISASQLRPVINEMTAAAPLKSGFLRKHFYHAALFGVNFARSRLMNVPTVSSLRWLSIDKKRRLVFLSNYSNTTDFYVREFLNGKTPKGVNFMFTNGQGFPDAEMLQIGGISKDPEGYMNVIHSHQHVTDLWYAHDYNLTVDQILRNRKLRNGLYKEMNEKEALRWLKLI